MQILPKLAVQDDFHPSVLAGLQDLDKERTITIDELRKAVPEHCFQASNARSFYYLFRDLAVVSVLGATAWTLIPQLDSNSARYAAWAIYGYLQGLQCIGIWVLGHECGHYAFSPQRKINDAVGFVVHSAFLNPYFSWKSTHRRHHIWANNLVKDDNHIPPGAEEYTSILKVPLEKADDLTEDAPVAILLRLIFQQTIGQWYYLCSSQSNTQRALNAKKDPGFMGNSHFRPDSTLFRRDEAPYIIASDIGVGLALGLIYAACRQWGWATVFLMYGQPYLWVNHWVVAITYLQHTHPDLPKYGPEAWTFLKGALGTVDRQFGWVGRHMMHNIIDYHVIHHLFPRIPQYHAEEATKAVMPLLGEQYHSDKERPYWPSLFEDFSMCQYVVPDDEADPTKQAFWYKPGPPPPFEIRLAKWLSGS